MSCAGVASLLRPAISGSDIGDGLECVPVREPDGVGASVELVAVNRGDRLCAARFSARSGGATSALSSAVAVIVHFTSPPAVAVNAANSRVPASRLSVV